VLFLVPTMYYLYALMSGAGAQPALVDDALDAGHPGAASEVVGAGEFAPSSNGGPAGGNGLGAAHGAGQAPHTGERETQVG
jgi:hypothetical protein